MRNQSRQAISKEQNEYAKNVKGEPIFILEAESGRKGYLCIGCGEEMEAVRKIKNIHHKSYFRHCAKDVEIERKCTFSNQDYRHRLAIDILQRTKRIKVPNLYKYAPDGSQAILLEETQFIEAHSVRAEVTFYEDDEAKVLWGKNPEIDNKNLLIRPDVTFFDVHSKPILLIEIVVSHKLDDEKKAKIKRLGIDTIQITIPKDSPENIANNFLVTKNTKWVFNHVEQNTNYFQLSDRNSKAILPIDSIEMGFFRESFTCRASQIRNVIRGIRKCVESQSYKRAEHQFEREISRIEEAAKRHRERLDELERKYEEDIFAEFKSEARSIEERGRNLGEKDKKWREYYSDVETRFYSESRKLKQEQEITKEQISSKFGIRNTEEGIREEYNDRIKNIRREEEYIAREEEHILNRERADREEEINYTEHIKRLDSDEQSRSKSKINRISKQIEDIERTMESLSADFAREIVKLESEYLNLEEHLREGIRNRKTENRSRLEEFRKSILQFMAGEMPFGIELSDRIKKLSEARRFLYNYEERKRSEERLRIIIECIRKGDYKKWDR